MIYTNLHSNHIRLIDICGDLTFENEFKHPDRILPYHDLVYVKSGGFNVVVENELIESREGDIMFLPAHKRHYPYSDNLVNSACYYLHFTSDEKDYISFEKNNLNSEFYCIPSRINIKDNLKLISQFHEMIMLGAIDIQENKKLLNALLVRILSEIDLLAHNQSNFKYSEVTLDIISILTDNVNKKVTINDLAYQLNFAPRTIQKNFKNDTGKSIHEYHLQLKLNKSKYFLIAYPKMSIKEIGMRFAFYDEFHYSKAFKKIFGLSPKQYRNK